MPTKTEILLPFQITEINNFVPNDVNYLQDDPYNPDGNSLVPIDANTNPIVTLWFQAPDGEFVETQRIAVKFTDPSFIGLHLEVYENNVRLYTSPIAYGSNVANFYFDSNILSDKTGELVRIKLVGHTFVGSTIQSLEAINWIANVEEEIISPFIGPGFNSTPYNRQMFNAAGIQLGGVDFIVNSDAFANPVRVVSGTASMNIDSNFQGTASAKRNGMSSFNVQSSLESSSLRNREGSAGFQIISELSSDSVITAIGSSSFSINSTMVSHSFRYAFNASRMDIDSNMIAHGSKVVTPNAILDVLCELVAIPLRKQPGIAVFIIDSHLIVLGHIDGSGVASFIIDSSLTSEPLLFRWTHIPQGETDWSDDKQAETHWETVEPVKTEWKGVVK